MMSAINQTSIVDSLALMAAGELTSAALVQACLDRIAVREPVVKAWAHLDADGAMQQAERVDRQRATGGATGLLHGIPIGIKDIFDVASMPTAAGTRAYPRRIADSDATSVARLRAQGGGD